MLTLGQRWAWKSCQCCWLHGRLERATPSCRCSLNATGTGQTCLSYCHQAETDEVPTHYCSYCYHTATRLKQMKYQLTTVHVVITLPPGWNRSSTNSLLLILLSHCHQAEIDRVPTHYCSQYWSWFHVQKHLIPTHYCSYCNPVATQTPNPKCTTVRINHLSRTGPFYGHTVCDTWIQQLGSYGAIDNVCF